MNDPQPKQKVGGLKYSTELANWGWPVRNIHITAKVEGRDLRLTFTSEQPQLFNWFMLPRKVKVLQLPIGEGRAEFSLIISSGCPI